MTQPLFSIIIPTYNRANTIHRCLSSVINQTSSNWEAIVVDNYSEDNTEEIVNSFNDERIHYYKNHNYGIIAVSRNFAIDHSQGNWICFLDSDDYWDKDKLSYLLKYIDNYDLIYHGFQTNSKKATLFSRNKILFYTIRKVNVAYVLKRSDPINPSCAAVSKTFLGNIRFNEGKELYAIEDYDFFLQILLRSPKVYHLKKYLTYYDATTGVSHNLSKQLDRNRIIIARYKEYLSYQDFRETLKYYMYLRGLRYLGEDSKKAMRYFKIAATAKAWFIKKRAIIGYIISYIKIR